MRIILDENLPKSLSRIFSGHTVTTVQEHGLAGATNGELLAKLEGFFDIFITADKNNRLPLLKPLLPRIAAAVEDIASGDYVQIKF